MKFMRLFQSFFLFSVLVILLSWLFFLSSYAAATAPHPMVISIQADSIYTPIVYKKLLSSSNADGRIKVDLVKPQAKEKDGYVYIVDSMRRANFLEENSGLHIIKEVSYRQKPLVATCITCASPIQDEIKSNKATFALALDSPSGQVAERLIKRLNFQGKVLQYPNDNAALRSALSTPNVIAVTGTDVLQSLGIDLRDKMHNMPLAFNKVGYYDHGMHAIFTQGVSENQINYVKKMLAV